MKKPKVAIAGAGIGGLTLAISLGRHGIPVTIFERAVKFERLGAGIVLAPNATFYLQELEVLAALCDEGQPLSSMTLRTPHGRALSSALGAMKRGRFDYPLLALHRADLQKILSETALSFSSTRLFMGAPVHGFQESEDGVTIIGPQGREEFDVLVGADGVHSQVRQILHGPLSPRYAGQTSFRGIAQGDFALDGRASETWDAGRRFGVVPIGKSRVYWFAVIDPAPGDRIPSANVLPLLKEKFAGFHSPIPQILALSSQVIQHDLADALPLRTWSSRRVTLLGDAAHPMTPNLGQGAGQSIEDAACLGRLLKESSETRHEMAEVLSAYEDERVARTTRFVEQSLRVGRLAHMRSPLLRALRNLAMRSIPPALAAQAHRKQIFGGIPLHAPALLNPSQPHQPAHR